MSKSRNTLYEKLNRIRLHEEYEDLRSKPNNLRNKFAIIIITVLFCSLCFTLHFSQKNGDEIRFSKHPGYTWSSQSVEADFSFPVYKDDETYRNEVDEARQKEPEVFIMDKNALIVSLDRVDTIDNLINQTSRMLTDFLPGATTDSALRQRINAFNELSGRVPQKVKELIKAQLDEVYKRGFINISIDSIAQSEICVRHGDNTDIILKKSRLVDSSLFKEIVRKAIEKELPPEDYTIAAELGRFCMVPNLKHSAELSKKAKDLAARAVPATEGIVRKGEIIIEKGQKVTDQSRKKLRSYYRSRFLKSEVGYTLAMFLGSFGHASLIMSLLIIYLFFIRKRIFYDNAQVAILCLIIALVSLLGWLSLEISTKLPVEYFILLPGLSMLAE